MKKLLTILIVSLLVLAGCSKDDSPKVVEDQGAETIKIAVPADMDGSFVSGYDNSAYDRYVLDLIWDYGVFYVDRDTGEYKDNPTVLDNVETEDLDGDKKYTFTIKEGLKWSDGEPVTAKDYVFSLLFRSSAEHKQYALQDSTGMDYVGYGAYAEGSGEFEGVALIDDNTFSVTISKEELPYFFERALVAVSPDPMHAWFPDAEFNDAGNGFTNSSAEIDKAAKYVQDEEQWMPSVTSGPYLLKSFQDNVASFELNDNYAGNYEGKKAEIGNVEIRLVKSDLIVEALQKGEVDVAMGNIEGTLIDAVNDDDNLNAYGYPRNGYGKLVLKTQNGATAYKEVRHAIAYLLDRHEFVEEVAGGYGEVVDGPYGLSQWFFQERKAEIEDAITSYSYNVDEANKALDASPYKYKEDGTTEWDGEGWRHDADGNRLVVNHFGSEDNSVTDLLNTQLPSNAKEVGMEYVIEEGPFTALLNALQGKSDKEYNSLNLASSFTAVYERYYAEHSDWAEVPTYNQSGIADADLDAAITKMRRLDESQRDEFADAFVEYVTIWNDLLPEIPLYSNEYHDFYTSRISGYEDIVTPLSDFVQNIVYMRVVD